MESQAKTAWGLLCVFDTTRSEGLNRQHHFSVGIDLVYEIPPIEKLMECIVILQYSALQLHIQFHME